MKFFFLLTFLTLSVQAEVVTSGGFGTDGATGESMPKKISVKNAEAIYKALTINPDRDGNKIISIANESHFVCSRPVSGINRLNAGCQFLLRASQKVKVTSHQGLSGTVNFSGKLATKILDSLPDQSSGRVGAILKTVANLSCSKVVRPGLEAVCTIRDTNITELDVNL